MSNTNIMVVEDSGIVLLDIQKNLKSLGYTVVATAATKEEAIRKAEETRPDLVLMDIRLGEEMGGIDAADYIREHFNIPIVFLTGYADEDTFQRAKITDPFGYILKPFDAKGLRTTIEIALHNHALKSRLRESERRYRTLVETMNDGVGQIDAQGRVIFVNEKFCRLIGYTQDEMIGREHLSLFPSERRSLQRSEFEERAKGIANSFETALLHKDGHELPVILSGSPVFDDSGRFAGAIGVFTDISERKQAEQAIRISEEKYRELFSEMSAGCALHEIICDANGIPVDYITLEVNSAYETILGVKSEMVVGKNASEFLPEAELKYWLGIFGSVALSGNSTTYEMYSASNRKYFEGGAYSPAPGKFAVTFLDVTERKLAEEEVIKSKQALEKAERLVHLGHYELNTETGAAFWSEEIFDIFGLDPKDGEHTVMSYPELVHPDDRAMLSEEYEKSVQNGTMFDLVYRIVRPDGQIRFVHSNASVMFDENEKATKLFGTFQDVTELKQVEIALQESEERYRALFDDSPIAIWEEDFSAVQQTFDRLRKAGVKDFRAYFEKHPAEAVQLFYSVKVTEVNQTSVAFFGASDKDEIVLNLERFMTSRSQVVFRNLMTALAEGETKFTSEVLVHDLSGQPRTLIVDLAVAPAYEQTLERVLVSFIDITERKLSESIMLARYRLVSRSLTGSVSDLLQATLDEIEVLTDSAIGFFHFVDPDQNHLSLQAWSTNTIEKLCKANGDGLHYPIQDAGVWVDCVYQRQPIIHNNYAQLKHRKGLPEGHAPVMRELVVPIMRGDKVVAVLGIGNKEAEYTQKDVEITSLLADLSWDIVERKQAEAALSTSEALYHDLVATAQDLIWQCDQEGRYIYLNPAWEDVFGYKREEMLGKSFADFQSPEYAARDKEEFQKILEGSPVKNYETVHIGKDGRQIYLVFNAKAIHDEHGNIIGTRGTAYDITERKRNEAALQTSEYLLREAQKMAKSGHYDLDISSGVWRSSDSLNQLFGIDWEYKSDVEGWLNIVHPEDREGMSEYFLNEVISRGQDFDREYRIVRQDNGQVRWVHGLGKLEVAGAGNPVRLIGNIQDVTEWKQAQDALQRRAHELAALQETVLEITLPHSLDELLDFIVERAVNLIGASGGGLYLADAEKRQVRCVVSYKTTQDFTGTVLAYGEGAAGRVAQTGEPLIIDDYRVWEGRAKVYDTGKAFQAVISAPLIWQGKVTGVLHLLHDDSQKFDQQDLSLLTLFANHASVTVENARLYNSLSKELLERKQAEDSLRAKTDELESLFSISAHLRSAQTADAMLPLVVQEMRRVLKSDANAVILYNPEGDFFTYSFSEGPLEANIGERFNPAKSISGQVMRTRASYVTEDLSSDPNKTSTLHGFDDLGPAMVVPVVSESEFLGALLCARLKSSNTPTFSDSDVRLLTAVGEMVGNAMRRARLYDQALMRLQHVQTLHSIDMAISANLELSVILDVLLTQGTTQLGVDAACILLLNPHTHMLEFASGNGFRNREIKTTRLRLGEGLPGQAVMDRKMLYVPSLPKSEGLIREFLLSEGFVAYQAIPLIAKGQLQGVMEIFNRQPIPMGEEQTGFLETLATQAAIAIDNSQLFSDLQRSNFELEMAYDATIEGWSRALELRDQETEGHTLRVTDMTLRLAQLMGVRSGELIHVRRGALLHDIGKMGVPDRILLKPGKLDEAEWEVMQQHTVYAFEMLWPIEFLRPSIDIPHCHHERWDGTGYPRRLKGEKIPLSARVFAVADVWDALTSDRPYRKAWSEQKALEYITSSSGTHFDPRVVEKFLELRGGN